MCRADTTLMAEHEEEPKSLLMKVKEESEKVALKLSIQRTEIIVSDFITSWQVDMGKKKREKVTDFIFLASKTLQTVTVVMKLKKKKKSLLLGRL